MCYFYGDFHGCGHVSYGRFTCEEQQEHLADRAKQVGETEHEEPLSFRCIAAGEIQTW